jgi:hypothetical protein
LAFGCILFEELTGARLRRRRSLADDCHVLRGEPNFFVLPADAPLRVRQVLQLCLRTNPNTRIADIAATDLGQADKPSSHYRGELDVFRHVKIIRESNPLENVSFKSSSALVSDYSNKHEVFLRNPCAATRTRSVEATAMGMVTSARLYAAEPVRSAACRVSAERCGMAAVGCTLDWAMGRRLQSRVSGRMVDAPVLRLTGQNTQTRPVDHRSHEAPDSRIENCDCAPTIASRSAEPSRRCAITVVPSRSVQL